MTGAGRLPRVLVEFYGLARLRAKRTELLVDAATVGEALVAADAACADLRTLCDGRVSAMYVVSVNGDQFATDAHHPLTEGAKVLIFGADAGG